LIASYGESLVFTITPADNYRIADVMVDGVSVGTVSTYEFTQIAGDHTIHVLFAMDTCIVTATSEGNGSISPHGESIVSYGDSLAFTITRPAAHHIADVLVDGVSVGAVSTYEFTQIDKHHTNPCAVCDQYSNYYSNCRSQWLDLSCRECCSQFRRINNIHYHPAAGYEILQVVVDVWKPEQ